MESLELRITNILRRQAMDDSTAERASRLIMKEIQERTSAALVRQIREPIDLTSERENNQLTRLEPGVSMGVCDPQL